MGKSLASVALLVMAFLAVPEAHAAGPAAAASALFEEGRAAMKRGDFDTACARFKASQEMDPAPGTLLNLADCEAKRGHVASAWEGFRAAIEKLPAGDSRIQVAEKRVAELEGRLPKLTLTLAPGAPKDTTAKEGATTVGPAAFGVALPLDPGPHRFAVTAAGRTTRTYDVVLAEGKTEQLTVEPGTAEELADGAKPAPAAPASADPPGPGPWIVGGIGVAGLLVGAITGGIVLQKKSATSVCTEGPKPTCPTQGAIDAANLGRSLGPVSTIGLAAGAVGVAVGAIWLGVRSPGKASVALGAGPIAGGAAWQARGSW